ncbi:conserved hypothetical protein [Roseibium sp. TrichSKD4]|uniref:DUF2834 domain-containing protein n=1 Tax=Roseibium sp. TrichSKD4 TaxID=744980 RepID=UPI0001E57246|nr:conserved hypothetical protein [Roseibium sp. TrichSKD4]
MRLSTFYLCMAVVGTVVPWVFFASFFASKGLDIPLFILSLFGNAASGGFSADVLISILVFWIWSFVDARQLGISQWWLVLPAGCFVGLSCALPLYLYFRQKVVA